MADSKEYIIRFFADRWETVHELIRCKDCIYYDKPHVENNGTRIEYDDLPEEAFENSIGRLVNSSYGINVGGRCCRDYNVGYSEDKRVFVPETNYCGRAERKTVEEGNRMTERKTGTWLDRSVYETKGTIDEVQSARCSVCGLYHTTPFRYYFDYYKYCPNCGTKMRGENNE